MYWSTNELGSYGDETSGWLPEGTDILGKL